MKAPFPWFGGKSKAATLIWSRFGVSEINNYVEPFLGSAAVFLSRPAEFLGWATLNDKDGLLVNFWRSVSLFPEETARAASHPVFEADLHARHITLVNKRDGLTDRLCGDPLYCDPLLAGWWAWGACVWIGSGWCAGDGPWRVEVDEDGFSVLTKGDGGPGVNRQLPHLGNGGMGVNRKLPHLGDGGMGEEEARLEWVTDWFRELRDSFRGARVACGDWRRICSPGTVTRNGLAGVLLDPPYSQTEEVYAHDGGEIASSVRAWCVENGDNREMRIALCGHEGEHDELEKLGWSVETWGKSGGYQGADDRERIWFSPHCRWGREMWDDLFRFDLGAVV